MRTRAFVLIFGLSLVSLLLLDTASVWARATSGGSRGSRSSSSPASPSSTPSSPSRVTTPDSGASRPMSQPAHPPGMLGGRAGGVAGLRVGGLLGSLLFGGMGGGFGGGIGLLELLLIGGGIFLVFRMLRGRDARPEPAYAGAGAYGSSERGWSAGGAVMETPPGESDLDRGIGHIRS